MNIIPGAKYRIDVTARLRKLEKKPSQNGLDQLKREAAEHQISLVPWEKRIKSLEKQIVLYEVMES
jgi:hypothetical protein